MVTSNNTSLESFINIFEYLKSRNVRFAIKTKYDDNNKPSEISIFVTITKVGKFFRANGTIIAGNFAKLFI